jgi:hypothetical protein
LRIPLDLFFDEGLSRFERRHGNRQDSSYIQDSVQPHVERCPAKGFNALPHGKDGKNNESQCQEHEQKADREMPTGEKATQGFQREFTTYRQGGEIV